MRSPTTVLVGLVAMFLLGSSPHIDALGRPPIGPEPSAQPLWFAGGHPTRQAIAVTAELRHAEERGLRPGDYDIEEIVRSVPELAGTPTGPSAPAPTPADVSRLDVALTLAVARFVGDLHSGRVSPREVGYDLDVVRPKFDVQSVLGTLAHAPLVSATLDGLEPQYLRGHTCLSLQHRRASRAKLSRPDG